MMARSSRIMSNIYEVPQFCVAQHNKDGYYLAFYHKKDDIGNLDKAVFALQFTDWVHLYEWWATNSVMISEINKHK
jgi:hypothetical protein